MGALYIVAAVALWSAVPLLIKQVAPPFDVRWVALLRLAMGAGFLVVAERLIAGRARAPGPPARPWRRSEVGWLLLGACGLAANYLLYTFGVTRTTASAANLVVQVEIICLALWGLLLLKESAAPAKLVGMGLCLSGVLMVAWNGQSLEGLLASQYFRGNLIVAAAGVGWSWYGLSQKVLLRTRSPRESVAPVLAIGGAIAALAAAFASPVSRPPTPQEWAYLAALGIPCTGVSYLLLARGMRLMEASAAALIMTLLPLFTMTQAHLLLGERITGFILGGAALIISGVGLIVLRGERASVG